MAIAKGKRILFIADILRRVSEFQILSHYLGISEIPCVIHSPIREDHRPSLGLYSTNGKKVLFYDFSTGDYGSTFDLLHLMWKCPLNEVLIRIENNLKEIKTHSGNVYIENIRKHGDVPTLNLQVKTREWQSWDAEYWFTQYGISMKWLKFGNVYPISRIFITKDGITYDMAADKYAYAYAEFKEGRTSLKIYQPYSEFYKWRNNHDASTWDLWEQLPKTGDKLIITSSRKDALCIWANTGIPSCSLQAESFLPKPHVVELLKNRFKQVYVLYDNDFTKRQNWGKMFGERLCREFNLIYIELPTELQAKDSSDLCKLHGRNKLKEVILSLIK